MTQNQALPLGSKLVCKLIILKRKNSMQTFDLEMAKHVQGGGFWSF